MSLEVHPRGEKQLREAAARALLRIAATFMNNEKAEWKQGAPHNERSKPGEHLKAETWGARDSLRYVPDSVAQVATTLTVYVGYGQAEQYAADWERRQDNQRRKGLGDKLQEFIAIGLPQDIMGEYTS